jgi:hypothetical protein
MLTFQGTLVGDFLHPVLRMKVQEIDRDMDLLTI